MKKYEKGMFVFGAILFLLSIAFMSSKTFEMQRISIVFTMFIFLMVLIRKAYSTEKKETSKISITLFLIGIGSSTLLLLSGIL